MKFGTYLLMNNVLAFVLFCTFTSPKEESSQYISFATLGKPPAKIMLHSENLSNSQDFSLSIPQDYKVVLDKNVCEWRLKKDCGEDIIIKRKNYNLGGLSIFSYKIQIKHHHDLYGDFLKVGGRRTLFLNDTRIATHTFPPTKIVGPKRLQFEVSKEKTMEDGTILVMNNDYGNAYYNTPELKVVPGERYLVSFRYLLPYSDECLFAINRYRDTFASWKVLDNIESKLKGDNRNYYKKFFKIVSEEECTSMTLRFKVSTEDGFLHECFIKDLSVIRLGGFDEP